MEIMNQLRSSIDRLYKLKSCSPTEYLIMELLFNILVEIKKVNK